jgi:hypothetical protein
MLGACEFNHRACLTWSVDRWNCHHAAPRPCVHTHARLTDHSFSSFNDMARPSGFFTDFDAAKRLLDQRRTLGVAERLLDRRRTLGAAERMQDSGRPRWQNGQNGGDRTWEVKTGWAPPMAEQRPERRRWLRWAPLEDLARASATVLRWAR